jgi:hypothetical protein
MLLANLNSTGTATVNVTIDGVDLDVSGTKWLYGQYQTTPLETPMATGLGNSFSVSVPFRSIVALLIDAAPTLDGDFNSDGIVDAADYVVWRKDPNLSTPPADYATWSQNFGQSLGSGSQSGVVPEVATLWSLVIGALVLSTARRRCAS